MNPCRKEGQGRERGKVGKLEGRMRKGERGRTLRGDMEEGKGGRRKGRGQGRKERGK
jgi:hypothetical protein